MSAVAFRGTSTPPMSSGTSSRPAPVAQRHYERLAALDDDDKLTCPRKRGSFTQVSDFLSIANHFCAIQSPTLPTKLDGLRILDRFYLDGGKYGVETGQPFGVVKNRGTLQQGIASVLAQGQGTEQKK